MRQKNKTQKKIVRKSLDIQFWLRRRGIMQKQIAKDMKVSEVLVSTTISGKRHGGRVLKHLKEIGVPEHFLAEKK